MRPIARKKTRALVVLVAITAAYAVTSVSPAAAANVTIGLCATTGTVTLPGAGAVPIWGFVRSDTTVSSFTGDTTVDTNMIANVSDTTGLLAGQAITGDGLPAGTTIVSVDTTLLTITVSANATATATGVSFAITTGCTGTATIPGPTIEVSLGDDVTINVTSALPGGASSASFEAAGLDVHSASAGTYTFNAGRVGTFEYQSPGDAGRQIAMGLSGALVVRPASEAAGFATGSCSNVAGVAYGTNFARECLLVMSAIDPNFNAAPLTFDLNNYEATCWLLNGTAYPNTPAIVGPAAGSSLLLRYVNTGYDNTAMSLLGVHEHVLARDAFSLGANQFDAAAEIIPAGATEDAVITMPTYAPPSAHGFPLFNRNLHLQNGAGSPDGDANTGGMLVFIQP